MQTFLPYPSFLASARCLDRQRLGKQRLEAWEIYEIVSGHKRDSRWANHPAVKMWSTYGRALLWYEAFICVEWRSRGYKDSYLEKVNLEMMRIGDAPIRLPDWFGWPMFHETHMSNLMRKLPRHYIPQFPKNIPTNLEYLWPINGKCWTQFIDDMSAWSMRGGHSVEVTKKMIGEVNEFARKGGRGEMWGLQLTNSYRVK